MQEHEEVQPVIHRERVQPTVKQVTQPIHETQVLPSTQEQKILPPQYKETLQPWVASPHCLFWDYDLLTRTSFTSNRGAGTAVGPRTDIPSSQTNVAETQKHALLKVLLLPIDLFWNSNSTRSLPSFLLKEPQVKETLTQPTVEQVQPVVQKDVEQHHFIQTQQPIHERVVEAPRVISEERAPIERT